jgi:GAF domain-containing protein
LTIAARKLVPGPPWSEEDRLAALRSYGILDTPPEPAFDEITRVASLVCKAPISVVNLIEDTRQFFKSETGLGVRETPVDISICAHAILQHDLFVVPDTTQDSRYACNPLCAGLQAAPGGDHAGASRGLTCSRPRRHGPDRTAAEQQSAF